MPVDPGQGLWSTNFVALLATNLLLCLGFYMLPATLPAYVSQMGATALQTSLVIGAFSLFSMVTRAISGLVIDAVGEAHIIWIGILTIALTTGAMNWASVDGILMLRSVQGMGWGLATAAIATVVYKTVPEPQRGEGAGYYSLTVIVPASLAPLLAILLMDRVAFSSILSVSLLVSCAGLVALKPALASLPPLLRGPKPAGAALVELVFERGALLPSILCFILSIPLCGVMAYLVLFGREQQIGNLWVFFVGYTLMILSTRTWIGRLFDARGPAAIMLPGAAAMLLGLVLLSQAQGHALLVAASLLFGLGFGAVQPSLQTWAVNRCPTHRKAAANGLFLSAIDLGYIVGSIVLAQLAQAYGFSAMYLGAAGFMVLFMLVYWLYGRPSLPMKPGHV